MYNTFDLLLQIGLIRLKLTVPIGGNCTFNFNYHVVFIQQFRYKFKRLQHLRRNKLRRGLIL